MTIEQARASIARAMDLGLSGAWFMRELGPERVARACNGIGPESWPEEARAVLNRWLGTFDVCADDHDCRFEYDNDGSDVKFRQANDELERNCLIVADAKYRWYNPLRYIARRKGRLMAQACRDFGWRAWRAAWERNQKKKGNES